MAPGLRSLFGVALALAVAAPLFRNARDDSYPFSTYPMFARALHKPKLTYAEGVDERGKATRLPPAMIGTDEPMQALRTLKLAAEGSKRDLKRFCGSVAARVAAEPDYQAVRRVRVVRAEFDPVSYFESTPTPEHSETLVQCGVKR